MLLAVAVAEGVAVMELELCFKLIPRCKHRFFLFTCSWEEGQQRATPSPLRRWTLLLRRRFGDEQLQRLVFWELLLT
jgi:hypothetical protein